jgi:hypothetical protein
VATSEGEKPITMCQPIVIRLRWPRHAVLTSTIGPGSRKRRACSTGKSFFGSAFIRGQGREEPMLAQPG